MENAIGLCESLRIDSHKHGALTRIMLCDGVILHVQPDYSRHDILHNSQHFITVCRHIDMQSGYEQENDNQNVILHDTDKHCHAGNIQSVHYNNYNKLDKCLH